jgi:hypothetical protein
MVAKKLLIGIEFILIILLFSCNIGISKHDLEQEITKNFQEKLDTGSLKEYNISVKKVGLVRTSTNNYDGIITVLLENEEYNIALSVKTDIDSYIYEIKDGSFDFLKPYMLKKMGY